MLVSKSCVSLCFQVELIFSDIAVINIIAMIPLLVLYNQYSNMSCVFVYKDNEQYIYIYIYNGTTF